MKAATTKSRKELQQRASSLKMMADIYASYGVFDFAAKNFLEAARIYGILGDKEMGEECRCRWQQCELGVAC